MPSVELSDQEWQQVINIIAMQPWTQANPLLMKIGQQLQNAQQTGGAPRQADINVTTERAWAADGKETRS
jgi:hypothetical protein